MISNLLFPWGWVSTFSNEIFIQIILYCWPGLDNNNKCWSTWRCWEWWWPLWSMLSDGCNIPYYHSMFVWSPLRIFVQLELGHTCGRKDPALQISHLCQQLCLINQSSEKRETYPWKSAHSEWVESCCRTTQGIVHKTLYCIWIIKWYWLW